MATTTLTGHSLCEAAPAGFQPKFDVAMEMTYQIVDGEPLFSFRTASAEPREAELLPQRLGQASWSRFMRRQEFIDNLDINIDGDCRVFLFADVSRPISWSLKTDAIVTQENLQDLYYDLRYWSGQDALKRPDFRGELCKKISFLAKLNTDPTDRRSQKFSYFVRIRDAAGLMIEHEIDPDIRNPGGAEG